MWRELRLELGLGGAADFQCCFYGVLFGFWGFRGFRVHFRIVSGLFGYLECWVE